MPVNKRKTNQLARLKKKLKIKGENKNVQDCSYLAVFAPKASAEEMNPYAGKTFEMTDKKVGTFSFYVTDDNHVMAVYPDNNRIGYTYNCFVAESGELVILDENNDSSIFVGAMNTDGTLLECDGTVWSCAD